MSFRQAQRRLSVYAALGLASVVCAVLGWAGLVLVISFPIFCEWLIWKEKQDA
jgi:hypothetical protein